MQKTIIFVDQAARRNTFCKLWKIHGIKESPMNSADEVRITISPVGDSMVLWKLTNPYLGPGRSTEWNDLIHLVGYFLIL
jgi:hypothetical protein